MPGLFGPSEPARRLVKWPGQSGPGRSNPARPRCSAVAWTCKSLTESPEILKWHLGFLPSLQSPCGVGVVFILQRFAALLMRGGVTLAYVTFHGDRKVGRGPSIFRQSRTVGFHQRSSLAQTAAIDDQPCI